MRVELDDEFVEQVVKNWLTETAIRYRYDSDLSDIAEACQNLLELNWPHLHE